MPSMPVVGPEIDVGDPLQAARTVQGGAIKITAEQAGRNDEREVAQGQHIEFLLEQGQSVFQQGAIGKVVLVLEAGKVSGLVLIGGGVQRVEKGKTGVAVLEAVEEEAAGQDVGAGDIGLQLNEVAEAPERRLVGSSGQVADKIVVVLEVLGLVEPGLASLQRAGNGETGGPLIQIDAANKFKRGQKVGAAVAQVVVADAGAEGENAGGGAAELGGITAGLHINGAQSVSGHAQLQGAVHRVGNVEAVQGVEGLVGMAAGDVGLAAAVLHYAGDVGQNVAVVACNRVRNIDDINSREAARVGNFPGINGGRGLHHIHFFLDLLQMVEFDFDGAGGGAQLNGLVNRVKAFLFDMQPVGSGRQAGKLAAAGKVSFLFEQGGAAGKL